MGPKRNSWQRPQSGSRPTNSQQNNRWAILSEWPEDSTLESPPAGNPPAAPPSNRETPRHVGTPNPSSSSSSREPAADNYARSANFTQSPVAHGRLETLSRGGDSIRPHGQNASRGRLRLSGPGSSSGARSQGGSADSYPSGSKGKLPDNSGSSRRQVQGIPQEEKVNLLCNHFKVDWSRADRGKINFYTVTVTTTATGPGTGREVLSKSLKREILRRFYKVPGIDLPPYSFAYNGDKELYSMSNHISEAISKHKVAEGTGRFTINVEHRGEFSVEIKDPTRSIDVRSFPTGGTSTGEPEDNDKLVLQALSVFLQHCSTEGGQIPINIRQSYYRPSNPDRFEDKSNVVLWEGFHSSFKLKYPDNSQTRADKPELVLNFNDTLTAVLRSQALEEFISNHLRKNLQEIFPPHDIEKLNSILPGIRVQTTYDERRYTIKQLSARDSHYQFDKGHAQTVTVERYFREKIPLQPLTHLDWPLVQMTCMVTRNGQPSGQPVYIPIELCKVAERQRFTKLSAQERAIFVGEGRKPPEQKKESIENSLKMLLSDTPEGIWDPFLREFCRIGIDTNMIPVEGRKLTEPIVLEFGGNSHKDVFKTGTWIFSRLEDNVPTKVQSVKTTTNLKTSEWAVYIFYPAEDRRKYGDLANELRKKFEQLLMAAKGGESKYVLRETPEDAGSERTYQYRIDQMLHRAGNLNPGGRTKLIVAVLPDKSSPLYGPLKKKCETTFRGNRGLITQCVAPMGKVIADPYLTNLALKINLKIGGENSGIDIDRFIGSGLRTCIFGIDVSHGSPGDTRKRSVAAVVASVENKSWSRYASRVIVQQGIRRVANQEIINTNQEIITDRTSLKAMAKELLQEFKYNHGSAPQQIIIYRDGVSESQFQGVEDYELEQFRDACKAVDENMDVKITLIVVQKRHHTRFFRGVEGVYNYNIERGTVVKSGACQSKDKDFFLCSHDIIKSERGKETVTSRPAHYTVIRDEIKLGQSRIENLTNQLCYCFGRATRAVSIPAPVYYAHVAAKHHRILLQDDNALPEIFDNLKTNDSSMFYI